MEDAGLISCFLLFFSLKCPAWTLRQRKSRTVLGADKQENFNKSLSMWPKERKGSCRGTEARRNPPHVLMSLGTFRILLSRCFLCIGF
jgi:hypothetical protein